MSDQKHLVFFLNNGRKEAVSRASNELEYLTLPHPKGSVPVVYLRLSGEIYELQTAAPRKHAAWFINQRVNSDKHFFLAAKIDPRFLILPYIERSGGKFSPLDQIVTVAKGCQRIPLDNAAETWNLHAMCDVKDLGDNLVFYRHNEDKTLAWLKAKVGSAAQVLARQRQQRAEREQTLFVSGFDAGSAAAAAAASVVTSSGGSAGGSGAASSSSFDALIMDEDKRVAAQIVLDYLSESMSAKLLSLLGYSASDMQASRKQAAETGKRKTDWELEMELERETLAYAMPQTSSSSSSSGIGHGASSDSGGAGAGAGAGAGSSSSFPFPFPAAKKQAVVSKPNAASKFNGGKPVEAKKSIANFFGGGGGGK